MKCPKCGKELTYEDYETYYDEENEDTSYYILCSDCGYDESEVEQYERCNYEKEIIISNTLSGSW